MTAPHEPTEATKAEVKALASMGIRHEDIAEYLGIDKKTMYKYYKDILSKGKITASHKVAQALFRQATEQNKTTAAIFWLKCHAGWRDRDTIDVNSDDEDVTINIVRVSKNKDAD